MAKKTDKGTIPSYYERTNFLTTPCQGPVTVVELWAGVPRGRISTTRCDESGVGTAKSTGISRVTHPVLTGAKPGETVYQGAPSTASAPRPATFKGPAPPFAGPGVFGLMAPE